jgi:hypothetical protein
MFQVHRADRDQVEKAAALIDALSFPKDDSTGSSSFACDQVPNPFLQRTYLAIELRHKSCIKILSKSLSVSRGV